MPLLPSAGTLSVNPINVTRWWLCLLTISIFILYVQNSAYGQELRVLRHINRTRLDTSDLPAIFEKCGVNMEEEEAKQESAVPAAAAAAAAAVATAATANTKKKQKSGNTTRTV